MKKIKALWQILVEAATAFDEHNGLKLCASLSFYTLFSFGPMLLVIIFFSNLFWERQAIEGAIHHQISIFVGDSTALYIQEIIKNASLPEYNFIAIIGFIILLIASTSTFAEMQSSINIIWNLKIKKGRSMLQLLKTRILSFALVSGLGLLLLTALIINAVLEGFMDRLKETFPQTSIVGIYAINLLITSFIVALLFGIIFKVMPDAIIRFKDVLAGAMFAAILFMIGRIGVGFYISNSNLSSFYGSAGSLVILLFWVFYSSIVLYFGAEFSKAYALKYSAQIKPKAYAITIRVIEIESGEKNVQQNEKATPIKVITNNKKEIIL